MSAVEDLKKTVEVWTLVVHSSDGRQYHGQCMALSYDQALADLRENYDPVGDLAEVNDRQLIGRMETHYALSIDVENYELSKP